MEIVANPSDTIETKQQVPCIPIFIYRDERDKFGDGTFCMTACFLKTGIHVNFTLEVEGKRQTVLEVEKAIRCNGTCNGRVGKKYEFSINKKFMPRYALDEIILSSQRYIPRQYEN